MKHLGIALVALAVVAPAFAQQGPHADPARDVIIQFLALDGGQVASWDQLVADRDAAAEPVRQAIADVETQLEALFTTGDPDATEVGLLVIERRDLGQQLGDIHATYVTGFEALLDQEQADKLGFIRRADRAQPLIPAFRIWGFLPPNPHPHL